MRLRRDVRQPDSGVALPGKPRGGSWLPRCNQLRGEYTLLASVACKVPAWRDRAERLPT
jgi:hypothetical protein